jgi:hypothetical protein
MYFGQAFMSCVLTMRFNPAILPCDLRFWIAILPCVFERLWLTLYMHVNAKLGLVHLKGSKQAYSFKGSSREY